MSTMNNSFPVADPECNLPLGDEMDQFSAISIHDLETYPTKDNMMLNSPGGYRAGKEDPLSLKIVGVKFKKETVITGVATQGYDDGTPDVQEWVTKYIVKFVRQKGGEEEYILDSNGKPKVTVRLEN